MKERFALKKRAQDYKWCNTQQQKACSAWTPFAGWWTRACSRPFQREMQTTLFSIWAKSSSHPIKELQVMTPSWAQLLPIIITNCFTVMSFCLYPPFLYYFRLLSLCIKKDFNLWNCQAGTTAVLKNLSLIWLLFSSPKGAHQNSS